MTEKKPKVSVNIACYNHDKYIGEAIQSVLDQTFQDFEIIVCDNGSTDNSLEVIKSFTDPRIKINSFAVNQQSTMAGNDCIIRGCGEYIALLCSDDVFLPDKLEKQVKYLDEHKNTGVVFTRVLPIDPKSKPILTEDNFYHKHFNVLENRTRHEWLNNIFYTADHSFCCSSAMIKRECFDKVNIFDIRARQVQDFVLWADLCKYYDVHIIDEKLAKMRYFADDTNLSALTKKVLITSFNEMHLLFEKYATIDNLDDFVKIFPQVKETFKVLDTKYIPFYLSILTIKCECIGNFKPAALTLLYNYMGSEENRKNLEKDFNFTHMDLYKISEENDIFNHFSGGCLDYLINSSGNPKTRKFLNFINNHVFGVWMYEDRVSFKILGVLKTHIRYRFFQEHILGIWVEEERIRIKLLGKLKTNIRLKEKEKEKIDCM